MKISDTDLNLINKKLQSFRNLHFERYSNKTFPSYRHVPGLTPHPIFDINGHSYGKKVDSIDRISEKNWFENENYLYAIDLFNYKYFWETHETLEDLWKLEPLSDLKLFIQGIIQLSAAYLKWIQNNNIGMLKLQTKGLNKFKQVLNTHPILCGIDLKGFIDLQEKFFSMEDETRTIPPTIELSGMNTRNSTG